MWLIGGDRGRDYPDTLASVEAYSPQTNTWRELPSLNQTRSNAVCGVVGGQLVVAGGETGLHEHPVFITLNSVEALNPATGCWVSLPPLPHPVADATACVLNGQLFVAGGTTQLLTMTTDGMIRESGITGFQRLSDTLQIWDGEQWTIKANLPTGRACAASFVHGGKMIVVGGRVPTDVDNEWGSPSPSVVEYDPQTNRWQIGTPLPSSMSCCSAVEHSGSMIVFGCAREPTGDYHRTVGRTLRYEQGTWHEVPADDCLSLGPPEGRAAGDIGGAAVQSLLLG
jgi:N-acetylneuraminic acid mutarotase